MKSKPSPTLSGLVWSIGVIFEYHPSDLYGSGSSLLETLASWLELPLLHIAGLFVPQDDRFPVNESTEATERQLTH